VYEMMGRYAPNSLADKVLKTDAAMASELLAGKDEDWEKMADSVVGKTLEINTRV